MDSEYKGLYVDGGYPRVKSTHDDDTRPRYLSFKYLWQGLWHYRTGKCLTANDFPLQVTADEAGYFASHALSGKKLEVIFNKERYFVRVVAGDMSGLYVLDTVSTMI